MAFNHLPTPKRGGGRTPRTDATVAVYPQGNGFTTNFYIPRHLLRAAGLPDLPGASLDILIGSGDDAGVVALTKGKRAKLVRVGAQQNPPALVIRTSVLGKARYTASACGAVAGNGTLYLTIPAGFPWTAPVGSTDGLTAARRRFANGSTQGVAA